MSGLDTQTHKHTHTQSDYRNPRCACAPRVNKVQTMGGADLAQRTIDGRTQRMVGRDCKKTESLRQTLVVLTGRPCVG